MDDSGQPFQVSRLEILEDAMDALERSVDASTTAPGGTAADSYRGTILVLYRSLVKAVKRLSSMGYPHYCNEV